MIVVCKLILLHYIMCHRIEDVHLDLLTRGEGGGVAGSGRAHAHNIRYRPDSGYASRERQRALKSSGL